MKIHRMYFIILIFIIVGGCVLEEPEKPSPTYKRMGITTTTSITPTTTVATETTETSITTTIGSVTTTTIHGNIVHIIAENNKFTPDKITLNFDDRITFILENRDSRAHILMNEDLKVNWYMPPKTNRSKEFKPNKKGNFYLNGNVEGMRMEILII